MLRLTTILFLMTASITAQWPDRPTPGLPRAADGKANLSAAAPRSADGKPDLSGVWRVKQGSYLTFITSDLKPDEIRPWAAALYQQRANNFRRDSDGIACLPPGPKAGISGLGFPMKIVQTPSLVVVLYEYDTMFRQIFTDGRAVPKDPNPTWMGYSAGHWEGDTLVVETAGFNDRSTLDLGGHPHTEALRITERFRRRDAGHIDLQVTLDDPKAYTRAWTLPVDLELLPDGELIEYVCENERDAPHLVGQSGEEARVPVEALRQFVGAYQGANRNAVVTLDGSRLMIERDNGGKVPLIAHSETGFTMEGTGVDFVQDAKGAVRMIQHWAEGDYSLPAKK